MAATVLTLVRLRFRVLGNTLRRSPMQRAAVALGAVQALALVAVAVAMAWVLLQLPTPIERQAPWVVVGSLVALGWVLAPIIVGGAEPTLEPRKLARFPLEPRRILLAEFLVGVTWVPGVATLLAALAGCLVWVDHPLAAAAAVVAAFIALVTCVVASRAATTLAAALVASRGPVGRLLATGAVVAIALLPVAIAVGANWPPWERLDGLVGALSMTPIGAVWAIPGLIAGGQPWGAGLALLVSVATIVGLVALWRVGLGRALRARGSRARHRRGRLGPFRIAPTGAVSAIAARSLVLWVRDARLVIQLAILPAVPVLLVVLAGLPGLDWLAYIAAPIAAALLPLSQFAGISYDGTAYASELAAAVPGRADRIGRSAALLAIALPAVVLISVVAPIVVGSPSRIPAVVGLALGALLTASGVAAVSSAMIAVPVPAAGRNPFASPPGANTTQVVGSYLVTATTGVLLAPVIVLGAIALVTGDAALGWWAFAVGILWGTAALGVGIVVGGRILDRGGPELFERLRRIRTR